MLVAGVPLGVLPYICLYSGVGTVAAVAALATTLFRPKSNIHNLL